MHRTLSLVLLAALTTLVGVMHWEDLVYLTSPDVVTSAVQTSVATMQNTPFWPVWLASTTVFVVLFVACGGLGR